MNEYGEMFYGTLPPDTQDFRQVLAGIGRTIRDRAAATGQRFVESAREARALQDQAFGDPTNPLRITDERALARLTDMIMGGPLGFAPAGITAFHGSPYLFRQFDPAKIGAGEGAQVYGVGAGYTAEARPVAESYREKLRLRDTDIITNAEVMAKRALEKSGMDKQKAVEMLKAGEIDNAKMPEFVATDVIDSIYPKIKNPEGFLYKGDIPDEILPKFLDWDKPLSQQSKEVKELLKKYDLPENIKGGDIYNSLIYGKPIGFNNAGDALFDTTIVKDAMAKNISPKAASDELEKLGIRGIRYLDQGSRGKGKGTSNFIPFRPEDYKIQEINDIPIQQYIDQGLL
jgi:hypothetical protein